MDENQKFKVSLEVCPIDAPAGAPLHLQVIIQVSLKDVLTYNELPGQLHDCWRALSHGVFVKLGIDINDYYEYEAFEIENERKPVAFSVWALEQLQEAK